MEVSLGWDHMGRHWEGLVGYLRCSLSRGFAEEESHLAKLVADSLALQHYHWHLAEGSHQWHFEGVHLSELLGC